MNKTELINNVTLYRSDFDKALKTANDAIHANDAEKYAEAINALAEAEKNYSSNYSKLFYIQTYEDAIATDVDPVRKVIVAHTFATIGHKEVLDDDKKVAFVEETTRDKDIDLLAFCKVNNVATPWADNVSKCNQLLCLRCAKSVGYSVRNLKGLENAYYLRKACEAIDMGGTPTSNNQMCKLLQSIVDAVLLPSKDEKLTITNYDVAYLDALYAKRSSKSAITLAVSKDGTLLKVLVDIMYRLLTNGHYGVDGYKARKN